jgi:hypothetical protein
MFCLSPISPLSLSLLSLIRNKGGGRGAEACKMDEKEMELTNVHLKSDMNNLLRSQKRINIVG